MSISPDSATWLASVPTLIERGLFIPSTWNPATFLSAKSALTEITNLQLQVSRLYNSHGSIAACLPADILLEIALLAQDAERPLYVRGLRIQATAPSGNNYPFGWLALTHVCHQWRQHLIDCRLLWARTIGELPRAVTTYMRRAGGTPLYVQLDLQVPCLSIRLQPLDGADRRAIDLALVNIDFARAKTLVIVHGRADVWMALLLLNVASAAADNGLPLLEKLELTSPGYLLNKEKARAFSTGALKIIAHKLKTLRLQNCLVHVSSTSLTLLHLSYKAGTLDKPNWRVVLRILETCPALCEVFLKDILGKDAPTHLNDGIPDVPFVLSALKSLDIDNHARPLQQLLGNVTLPTSTRLKICLNCSSDDDCRAAGEIARCIHECHFTCATRFAPDCRGSGPPLAREFSAVHASLCMPATSPSRILRLKLWCAEDCATPEDIVQIDDMEDDDGKAHPTVYLRVDAGESVIIRWPALLSAYCECFSPDSVSSLAFRVQYLLRDNFYNWRYLLHRFTSVRELHPLRTLRTLLRDAPGPLRLDELVDIVPLL